jgi:pimeloyl-ACP methyl ester carboxylesterase
VALQLTIRHSGSVRKLVVVSAPFKRDGWYNEVLVGMAQMGPAAAESMKDSPLAQRYPNVKWAVLFTKLADLLKKDDEWSKAVAAIRAPTMIVFADADAVRTSHVVEIYGLLGGGKKDAGPRWFRKARGPARHFARPRRTTTSGHPSCSRRLSLRSSIHVSAGPETRLVPARPCAELMLSPPAIC